MANPGVLIYLREPKELGTWLCRGRTNEHRPSFGPKLGVALARRSTVQIPFEMGRVLTMAVNRIDSFY
jgi:hypothetical protein